MKSQEPILALARERFRRCVDAERDNRAEAKIDNDFVMGKQWDEAIKRVRESGPHPRPSLVFNKLLGPIAQVSNEARRNKPSIKTSPIGSGASKDTSEVMQGMARHITYASNGDVSTEVALDSAVRCGMGYFGFLTRYADDEDPENLDQEIVFRTFKNPFLVYIDPDCKEPDYSDMRYAFVIERLTKREFEVRYPKSEAVSENFFEGAECPAPEWFGENVMVAEYWHVDEEKIQGKARVATKRRVMQDIINGVEVLEQSTWAGKYIPILPVYGPELTNEDGITHREGLIRQARDPQRLHNVYKSIEAESIGLAPRPKWKGAVGQFKSRPQDFANPNALVVQYDPIATNGQPEPPPKWETFEPPVQALSLGALQSADDIKAATNVFDASLGARSNETSGKAIDARKMESDMANSHFLDNLARAVTFAGKQLIDLIPKIYDTDREVQILGEDEAVKVVRVNAPHVDPATGKPTTYMLSEGRYGVIAKPAPSFGTRREEAFELLSDLAKAYPPLMQLCGDLIFRSSDIPGADVLADRFKKTLPPALQQDDKQAAIPPAAQATIAQQNQMLDQLTATVHRLAGQIENKTLELASRERIALIQARAGLQEAAMRAQSAEALAMFDADIQHIETQLSLIPDPALQQQADLQQGQQQHDARMQAAQFAHQRGVQQQQQQQAPAPAQQQQEAA